MWKHKANKMSSPGCIITNINDDNKYLSFINKTPDLCMGETFLRTYWNISALLSTFENMSALVRTS